MDDIYLDYLAHHGILGMKWGIRRFQDYGHGGYDPKHKGQFRGRRKAKISKSKSVAKKGQTGGKLTEEQKARIKKTVIVGAAVAGTALAAYGTYKVSKYVGGKKLAKSIAESGPTILNKNTGQKFAGDAADVIGNGGNKAATRAIAFEKLPKGTVGNNKTFSALCQTTNKYNGKKNCGPVSASMLAKVNNNVDLVPKNTGITTWDQWEKVFVGAKHSTVDFSKVEDHKSLSAYLEKKFKDGDNGMLRLPSVDSSQFDDHFITFSKENGKMIFRDAQPEIAPGFKGFEFDSQGNVSIGGRKLTRDKGSLFVENYFKRYDVGIVDYMQANGHDITNDTAFLKQFFE